MARLSKVDMAREAIVQVAEVYRPKPLPLEYTAPPYVELMKKLKDRYAAGDSRNAQWQWRNAIKEALDNLTEVQFFKKEFDYPSGQFIFTPTKFGTSKYRTNDDYKTELTFAHDLLKDFLKIVEDDITLEEGKAGRIAYILQALITSEPKYIEEYISFLHQKINGLQKLLTVFPILTTGVKQLTPPQRSLIYDYIQDHKKPLDTQ